MNNKGYRLGYGRGYYDRYLVNSNCVKIALVYEQCLINESFEEEWDIKFDYIVTENKIIEVK
jgi:5-formyltetrahydrofolate cyclo-ligase